MTLKTQLFMAGTQATDSSRHVKNVTRKGRLPAIDPCTPAAIAAAIDPPPTATATVTVYPPPAAPTVTVYPPTGATAPAVYPSTSVGLGRRRKPGAPKDRRRNCRTGPLPHALEKQSPGQQVLSFRSASRLFRFFVIHSKKADG
jgi:hypothetical protein